MYCLSSTTVRKIKEEWAMYKIHHLTTMKLQTEFLLTNCPNELSWRHPETIYSSGSKIRITLILPNDRKIVTRSSSKLYAVHNMFQSNQVGWSPTGNRRLSFVYSVVEAYYTLDLIAHAVSLLPYMFVCFVLYMYIWLQVWFGLVFS